MLVVPFYVCLSIQADDFFEGLDDVKANEMAKKFLDLLEKYNIYASSYIYASSCLEGVFSKECRDVISDYFGY